MCITDVPANSLCNHIAYLWVVQYCLDFEHILLYWLRLRGLANIDLSNLYWLQCRGAPELIIGGNCWGGGRHLKFPARIRPRLSHQWPDNVKLSKQTLIKLYHVAQEL